jgi:hypothetical protein
MGYPYLILRHTYGAHSYNHYINQFLWCWGFIIVLLFGSLGCGTLCHWGKYQSFGGEYDAYHFNVEVFLKKDVTCSSEMLVSNDKTAPYDHNTEPQNVYSEIDTDKFIVCV